jgi:hypothetical protein
VAAGLAVADLGGTAVVVFYCLVAAGVRGDCFAAHFWGVGGCVAGELRVGVGKVVNTSRFVKLKQEDDFRSK